MSWQRCYNGSMENIDVMGEPISALLQKIGAEWDARLEHNPQARDLLEQLPELWREEFEGI